MASAIDATKPTAVTALTADVRNNFSAAKTEIEALQTAVAAAGDFKSDGTVAMTGAIATTVGTMTSSVANGAAAKAFSFNTSGAYTTTAKLASWANNGTEKAYIQQDGAVVLQNFLSMTIGARGANGWDSDGRSVFVNGGAIRYSYNYSSMLETPALAPLSIGLGPTTPIKWGATNHSGTYDVGLYRNAAGVVEVNNGTAGTFRDVKLRNEISTGVYATSSAAPTIASAGTIAPTVTISFVSGTTTIQTITAPSPISAGGGQITLIPTGLWSTNTAGNIALATTAVVSKALTMTYDVTTAKWYPSY